MVKFLQVGFLLLLLFKANGNANAQPENNLKKVEQVNPNSSTGIKPQSNSSGIDEKSATINSNETQSKDLPNETNIDIHPSQESTISIQPLENIPFDYSQMPTDVQLKIDANKVAGKSSLDNIEKVFTVEIKSCTSADVTKNALSFLNTQTGFIRVEFVKEGLVRIIVMPKLDSVVLKEKIISGGISFNFLNEFFQLKK